MTASYRTPSAKTVQALWELLPELVVWSCNIGFTIGACDDLIDGHNFSLNAIQEASSKLVPPVGCCIGAIGSVVIPWVGPGSQVKDVYLCASPEDFLQLSNNVHMQYFHRCSAC